MSEFRRRFSSLMKSSVRFYGALFLVFFTLLMVLVSLTGGYMENLTEMRQGEIRRLVEIAHQTIQPIILRYENGEISREQAIEEARDLLRRMVYRSETMDNYLFMSSYDGTMLLQPLEPHLEGTYQWDAQDAKGNYYIRDLVKTATGEAGEGFVFYYYPPPGSDNPGKKLSWVKGLPSLGCYIGTGMYFNDINSLVTRYLLSPLVIIVVVFFVVSVLFAFFLRPVARCFQILSRAFSEISQNPWTVPRVPVEVFREGTEERKVLEGFNRMLEVTEEHREQVIREGRLSSLEILVAGVAHEINNPNQFIMTNAGLIKNAWKDMKPVLDEYLEDSGDFSVAGSVYSEVREEIPIYLEGMETGAQRINKIVSDLKSFSRQDTARDYIPVEMNSIIRSAVNLCFNMIKNATDYFHQKLEEDLPPVMGNSQRLEQVVINLLQNSCKALVSKEQPISLRSYTQEGGRRVVVEVSDQGEGIDREDLHKVTSPFFTTRRSSGGTGLGLSICRTIVDEHGGTLRILSEKGRGTTVLVTLPALTGDKEWTG